MVSLLKGDLIIMGIRTDILIQLRTESGMTQAVAASKIGVSQPAYQRYESGVRTPSIQVTKAIANTFNTSTAYLTGESKDKEPDSITVTKEESPLLFLLVEQCQEFDDKTLNRLLKIIKRDF